MNTVTTGHLSVCLSVCLSVGLTFFVLDEGSDFRVVGDGRPVPGSSDSDGETHPSVVMRTYKRRK